MELAEVDEYLRRHRVQALVNEAINSAVVARAEDPVAHVALYLARVAGVPVGGAAPSGAASDAAKRSGGGGSAATASAANGAPAPNQSRLDQLTEAEARCAEMLLSAGQQHIFEGWAPDGVDSARKREFFASVMSLDRTYPGGLRAYLANAKRLLSMASLRQNPLDGWVASPPEGGHVLQPGSEEFDHYESIGVRELHRVAFVVPAGGMGERLGYSGVKFGLPAEMTTECKVLDVYAQYIRAFERMAARAQGAAVTIPIALMVSQDTRPGIEALLRDNRNFGLKPSQIVLLQQEKVAAFSDAHAHVAMRDAYSIETKPHGHGDVHFLLHTSSLAQRWLSEGRHWITFFQDTGTLYLASFLATLGASAEHGLDMNSVTVPRKAKDAIGAMARLTHADGRSVLASVEYNQLEPLLRASGLAGDVNDSSTDFSPFPGNINKLIFRLPAYVAALSYSKGQLPEFVNPKFATGEEEQDASKFKTPTRLECMMQDFSHVLQSTCKDAKVGYTQLPAYLGYFPIKNNLKAAAELSARGIPPMGAASAEAAVYHAYASMLRVIGCKVGSSVERVYAGVRVEEGPKIVLSPFFAPGMRALHAKFLEPHAVEVSQRSTLVIDGENVTVRSLKLDGALVIKVAHGASLYIESLEMRNQGWSSRELSHAEMASSGVPEVMRMRGYRISRDEQLEVLLTEPGQWRIVKNQLVRDEGVTPAATAASSSSAPSPVRAAAQ